MTPESGTTSGSGAADETVVAIVLARSTDTVQTVEERFAEAGDFDVIWLRQDPPFDMGYVTSTHLLDRVHPQTLVVNDPFWVRNCPEKLMVLDFPDLTPPTMIAPPSWKPQTPCLSAMSEREIISAPPE